MQKQDGLRRGSRQSTDIHDIFQPATFTMSTGWMKNSKNQKWYFEKGNGRMKTGLRPIDGRYYYFDPKTGAAKQGIH